MKDCRKKIRHNKRFIIDSTFQKILDAVEEYADWEVLNCQRKMNQCLHSQPEDPAEKLVNYRKFDETQGKLKGMLQLVLHISDGYRFKRDYREILDSLETI